MRPGRVVYLAHTPADFPFGRTSLAPSRKGTELLRRVAAIVCISNSSARYIRDEIGVEPVVVHPPVYGEGPFPNYGRFEGGSITIINPSAIKGLPIFVALARALPTHDFAAVASWATTRDDVLALTRLPNVRVLEPGDVDTILCSTKILLAPSLYQEGFGLVVVDAMLRGIPVIASNVGGLPEAKLGVDYVLPVHPIERFERQRGHNAPPVPVVPPQDEQPWIETLRRLVSDPEHYETLSRRSRQAAIRFVSGIRITDFEAVLDAEVGSCHDVARGQGDAVTAGRDTPRATSRLADASRQDALLALRRLHTKG